MDEVHNVGGMRPDEVCNAGEGKASDIVVSCTSEYKDYTFNEKHDIWSLVTLKAPCQAEDDTDEKRAPVDIVAVIDKSGSMSGTKIKLVKKTLEFILTQLTDKDRLSVVTYDANVYVDFALRNMSSENKDFASKQIKAISEGSTTNLCGGLMKGLCQMINRKEKNEVASVLLFTDGLANNGITSSAGIVAAMADPKRFEGPSPAPARPSEPKPHQSWLKNIFDGASSTSSKNETQNNTAESPPEMIARQPTQASGKSPASDYTVYTFGFGEDHNPDMLKEISDAGNGMYYYVENEDKIAESFGHCLGGLMSTVAQGIQLEITTEDGVTIKEVHTAKPSEKVNDRTVKVNIGDLQSEEKRDVVLELTIDVLGMPHSDTKHKLLSARVDYFNVITSSLVTSHGELGVLRPEKTAVVHNEQTVDRGVGQQRARVKMTSAMKKAREQAESGHLEEARGALLSEVQDYDLAITNAVDDEERDCYLGMKNDLSNITESMENATMYNARGKKLQANMAQQYCAQRSNNLSSEAFATKGNMKRRAMAKSFVSK